MFSKTLLTLTLFVASAMFSCKQSSSINATEAGQKVSAHLKANPQSENQKLKLGKLKFNSNAEMDELAKYKTLADSGYATLQLVEAKKKFLSRDSSYTYQIALTEKAIPYTIEQKNDKATMRVWVYALADEQPVDFAPVNDNNVKATVTLKKIATPFTPFAKSDSPSAFITKTYKLHFDKEQGWTVK